MTINQKKSLPIMGIVVVCCTIMSMVDGILQPSYGIKSAIKIILFLLCPLIYGKFNKDFSVRSLFKPNKKGLRMALFLGVGTYVIIISGYLIFSQWFSFDSIASTLESSMGVTKDNFVAVSLYISFANSLLEEFFFRGFAFVGLKNLVSRKTAYLFSSFAFSLYHVAMMVGWFSWVVFGLSMLSLVVGGMLFNYLNERNNTIYTSWLVHMFANFAINSIGMVLLGVI